ncbi:DUF6089 family protein [Reichenbachiella carrageenanivorans]|uniref:DUF6089 family protein n=1 Tax=Reichenbachiella carrageenanivorans TaxID=2979869 RepID=A0ABY6D209_9BACT|nr:DUF6089 family protein [Reichenbachiella carrageenanivorans]UXX80197.1 DUF6089 family protein [Reichenbachiella carrageenanivorans]
MRKSLITSLVLLLLVVCASDSFAQKRRYGYNKYKNKKYSNYSGGRTSYRGVGQTNYWTMGLSVNVLNYYGDLSPSDKRLSTNYGESKFGFGITGSRMVYPGIFFRAGYNYGVIEGDDSANGDQGSGDASLRGRYLRNLHFKNNIHELSVGFEADMIPNNGGVRGRFPINPYIFFGAAVIAHSPKAIAPETDQAGNALEEAGQWVNLRDLGTEGQNIDSLGIDPYSKFAFVIPVGLGLKVKLHHNFDLNFEIGFRKTFTDYLDDVSNAYVDLDAFGDDNLARAMSERGAETTSALTGADRGLNPTVGGGDIAMTGPYTHGSGYAPGQENSRGGSDYKDFYITTQIRLVYIFDKKGASRGKFR